MEIKRAYKTELDPTNKQKSIFWRHVGATRHVYNWGLRWRTKQQNYYKALEWVDINMPLKVDGILIEECFQVGCSFAESSSAFTVYKKNDARWLYDIPATTSVGALRDLENAFQNFFRRAKEGSDEPGYPKYKGRGGNNSFHTRYNGVKVEYDKINIPGIGGIKLKEKGYLPYNLHINSVTISEKSGRWYISLQVNDEIDEGVIDNDDIVGIDVGVKTFAVLSDGVEYEHPRPLRTYKRKLKRIQRSMSKSRLMNGGYDKKGKPLRGWSPTENYKKHRLQLSKVNDKISRIRKDFINKTTTEITKKYKIICVEGLDVKEMTSKKKGKGKTGKRSNRSMLDQGWGEFTRQLQYKCEWYGSIVVVADKYFPSTKMCSVCGNIKDKMPVTERTYKCDECGSVIDRDENASHNLKAVAVGLSDTLNACGDRKSTLSYHGFSVKVHGRKKVISAEKQEPGGNRIKPGLPLLGGSNGQKWP